MIKRRHFSEMTKEEMSMMSTRMEDEAAKYAQEIGISGLSHLGVHNLYAAIQDTTKREWEKSKANYRKVEL